MIQIDKRLILQFPKASNSNAGQHIFRHFDPSSTNDDLFQIAEHINAFQADALSNVLIQRVVRYTV